MAASALLLNIAMVQPAAIAVGAEARVRQVAGAIPIPYAGAVAVARAGNDLFVLDGHAVERVDLARSSAFFFLAGKRHAAGSIDGTAGAARFNRPLGVTTDGTHLYVADTNNHTIRRILIATGAVTTLAGAPGQAGSADGTGGAARFKKPYGLALLGGHLWITDAGNKTMRKMDLATATVTTVAGQPGQVGTTDGTGAAARFTSPRGIATNGKNLWVTDGNRVRKLAPGTGSVTTLTAVEPELTLTGVTFAGGKLYAIHPNYYNEATEKSISSQVRRIDPVTGAVNRFTFTPHSSQGIASDSTSLFVAEHTSVSQRALDSGLKRQAGSIGEHGTADGIGPEARFQDPRGITTDGSALYVADPAKDAIRKVQISSGEVTTMLSGIVDPLGLTIDGSHLYVSQGNRVLRVVIATGETTELAVVGSLVNDIASTTSDLYVANADCAVYKVHKTSGAVSVLAGVPGSCGTTDGVGPTARLAVLEGITLHNGDLFVTNHSSVRRIVAATGQVSTVANSVELAGLVGITSDGTHLYAVERHLPSSIRRIDPLNGAVTTVMSERNPLPLTYNPTLASATSIAFGYSLYGIVADQGRLFFTNLHGVGMVSDA